MSRKSMDNSDKTRITCSLIIPPAVSAEWSFVQALDQKAEQPLTSPRYIFLLLSLSIDRHSSFVYSIEHPFSRDTVSPNSVDGILIPTMIMLMTVSMMPVMRPAHQSMLPRDNKALAKTDPGVDASQGYLRQ